MNNQSSIGLAAGFLVSRELRAWKQNGSEVTGEMCGQRIIVQNAHFSDVAWLSGRALRIATQCTGIGALVLYLIELHIAHSDPKTHKTSIIRALVFIAHWVPITTQSADAKQKSEARKHLDAIRFTVLGISIRKIKSQSAATPKVPRERTTAPEAPISPRIRKSESNNANNNALEVTIHYPRRYLRLSLGERDAIILKFVPAEDPPPESVASPEVDGDSNGIAVSAKSEGDSMETTLDCTAKQVTFIFPLGDTSPMGLKFADNARIGTIKLEGAFPFNKVRIPDGIGVGNAITLLKAAKKLEKTELLFPNASDDDWHGMLAAVSEGCQVFAPNCPSSVRARFSKLVFGEGDH
jgi:hypothetical protein